MFSVANSNSYTQLPKIMKSLPFRSLSVVFTLFLLFGCTKDRIILDEVDAGYLSTQPLTVQDAKDFFARFNTESSNSLISGENFLRIEPDWDYATLDQSRSGNQILVVPIKDRSVDSLNGGRADVKLQFRKFDLDSIVADVVLYVADSAYFVQHGMGGSEDNFSGQYLFFDLALNFRNGVVVVDGEPVGWVESASTSSMAPGTGVEDRDEGNPCIFISYIAVNCYCQDAAFTGSPCPTGWVFTCNMNFEYYVVECWGGGAGGGTGGGGGGGTGGGGGGSSGGAGGGGSPGSSGNPGPPSELDCTLKPWICTYWFALAQNIRDGIPVLPGNVPWPDGFDQVRYGKYIRIIDVLNISDPAEYQWLIDHPDLIDFIYSKLPLGEPGSQNHGEPGTGNANLNKLIAFAAKAGITSDQFVQLYSRPELLDRLINLLNVYHFDISLGKKHIKSLLDTLAQLGYSNDAVELVSVHIDAFIVDSEYRENYENANFPKIGSPEWAETLNLGVEEVPRTTQAERALALTNPVQALIILKNREIAKKKQRAFWGNDLNVTWLGKGDAFLHTYFQAINTRDIGAPMTKLFSDAHETEHPPILHLETEMDLFNNGVGIQTGLDSPWYTSNDQMANIVHQKVLDGFCLYLDPVDHELSPTFIGLENCSYCLNGILPTTVIKPTNE